MGGEGVNEVEISGRRLRLLCLHGFRTSGKILEKQLAKWDASIHELLDLTFLEAPLPAAGKSAVEGIYPPPYFEWFRFNKDFTEYEGLQEVFDYIAQYMKQHGPFDGLLGFSQGAILSAYLVSSQEKGLLLQDIDPLRLVIILSGAKFPSPKLEAGHHETIKCPAMHFIGEKDYLRKHGEKLVNIFENPIIIRHSYGHTIPRLDVDTTSKVVNHLKQEIRNLPLISKIERDLIFKEDRNLQEQDCLNRS